jgi:DtxR family Mn-dependent transcriptional regulator
VNEERATRVVEDYVARIWKAEEWGDTASTTELAASVGVTSSTVSATLKKLARDGFIHYEPYGAVSLTDAGRQVAQQVVRRHRILETYLVEQLGMSWDEVHEEADALEHSVSTVVLERMMEKLGQPTRDPHGDPIPAAGDSDPDREPATAPQRPTRLSSLEVGDRAIIDRFSDRDPELLRHFVDRDLRLGQQIVVASSTAATGLIVIATGDADVELSIPAAGAIGVVPL